MNLGTKSIGLFSVIRSIASSNLYYMLANSVLSTGAGWVIWIEGL